MIYNINMLSSRMLSMILWNIHSICIITIYSKNILTNTKIFKHLLQPKNWVQQLLVAIYSPSTADKEIEFCFLLCQNTKLFLR